MNSENNKQLVTIPNWRYIDSPGDNQDLQNGIPQRRFGLAKVSPLWMGSLLYVLVILLLVAIYLFKDPVYQSQMQLVMPSTGASNKLNLSNIGEVTSQTNAPSVSNGFNPRINYKEIMVSRRVLENAAMLSHTSVQAFGLPKIKLTEQTSIIDVKLLGASPKLAQLNVENLYRAFQQELDRLRADEVNERDASIKAVLSQYYAKLQQTRTNIVNFKQTSLIVSEAQVEDLMVTLASLKEQSMGLDAEVEQLNSFIRQLSLNLGVSPVLAGKVFKLQTDAQFNSYISELNQSLMLQSEYTSRWGKNHPKVVAVNARVEQVNENLESRSMALIGIHLAESFNVLDLQQQNDRGRLFAELIQTSANKEGKLAQLSTLGLHIAASEDRLKVYTREASELDRLEKEFEVAQAIYTSAAARLEAGKADIFASYPVVQQLTPPMFNDKTYSPKLWVAVVFFIVAMIFLIIVLLLITQRKRIVECLLNKK